MPTFTIPSIQDLSLVLGGQGPTLAFVLLAVGLIFMLMGVRFYTILIMLSFGGVGFVLGSLVPVEGWPNLICAGAAAVGLAAASVYLMRAAVAILAGGWAGVSTAALLQPMVEPQVSFAAGIAVMVMAVALTFVMFEQIIAFVTSLEGSLLFLSGLALLLSQYAKTRNLVDGDLGRSGYFAAFIILGGTVIGYYSQMAEDQKKKAGASD